MVFIRKYAGGEGADSHRDQRHPPSVPPPWGAPSTWDTMEMSRVKWKEAGEPTSWVSCPRQRGLLVEPAETSRYTPLEPVEGASCQTSQVFTLRRDGLHLGRLSCPITFCPRAPSVLRIPQRVGLSGHRVLPSISPIHIYYVRLSLMASHHIRHNPL